MQVRPPAQPVDEGCEHEHPTAGGCRGSVGGLPIRGGRKWRPVSPQYRWARICGVKGPYPQKEKKKWFCLLLEILNSFVFLKLLATPIYSYCEYYALTMMPVFLFSLILYTNIVCSGALRPQLVLWCCVLVLTVECYAMCFLVCGGTSCDVFLSCAVRHRVHERKGVLSFSTATECFLSSR